MPEHERCIPALKKTPARASCAISASSASRPERSWLSLSPIRTAPSQGTDHMLKEVIPVCVNFGTERQYPPHKRHYGSPQQGNRGPGVVHDRLGDLTFVISIPSSKSIRRRRSAFMKLPFPYAALKERNGRPLLRHRNDYPLKRHGTPWESRLSHQRLLTPEKCRDNQHLKQ